MGQAELLITGIGSGALCAASVILALARRWQFQRTLAAARMNAYPLVVGYQRYRQRGVSFTMRVVLLLLVGWCGMSIGISLMAAQSAGQGTSPLGDLGMLTLICLLFAPAFALPLTLYRVVSGAIADAPALAQLRGAPTRPRDLIILQLKVALGIVAPATLATECIGLSLALRMYGLIEFAAPVVLVLLICYLAVGLAPLQRWFYPGKRIEQTRWAALKPRIEGWARLSGMRKPLRAIYVRDMARYGTGESAILRNRRSTIFLNETFLANSEWRQQDAMIGLLLKSDEARRLSAKGGTSGKRITKRILFAIVIMLLSFNVFTLLDTNGTSGSAIIDALASTLAVSLPILLIVWILILMVTRNRRNKSTGNYFAYTLDRLCVDLTGDPLAVMATLSTLVTLNGGDPQRRVLKQPSIADRIAALDQLARQPRPRAPWAHEPVPSMTPMQVGPYTITVPLTPEAQAATPGPLPLPFNGQAHLPGAIPMAMYPSPPEAMPLANGQGFPAGVQAPVGQPVTYQPPAPPQQ